MRWIATELRDEADYIAERRLEWLDYNHGDEPNVEALEVIADLLRAAHLIETAQKKAARQQRKRRRATASLAHLNAVLGETCD